MRLLQADATALPFTEAVFDAVVLADVLEHVPQLQSALTEAARVLKTGGSVLVSTLNRSPCAYVAHKALWPRVLVCYPKEGHDWCEFRAAPRLSRMMEVCRQKRAESPVGITRAPCPAVPPRMASRGAAGPSSATPAAHRACRHL